MIPLFSLQSSAMALLTDDFVDGALARWPEEAWQPHAEDTEREVDIAELLGTIDELLQETKPQDPGLDIEGAARLHRALPVDRRIASDPGIWRYLAIVARPELVRHRWRTDQPSTRRSRFWGFGTRPDSNAFCRLWWIAELTRSGDDYQLTGRILRNYTLTTALFVRELAEHRPLLEAAVEVLGDAPASVVDPAMKRMQARLSISTLERLKKEELITLLRRFAAYSAPARNAEP